MRKSIMFELYKLKKRKIIPVFALIIGAAIIITALTSNINGFVIKLSMPNFAYTVLSCMMYAVLPLISFLICADSICGERERNEIKLLMQAPISGTDIFLGKALSVFLCCAALLAEAVVLSAAAMLISGHGANINILRLALSYTVSLLPTITICFMAAATAVFFKSASSAFSGMLCIYIGTSVVCLVFPQISPIMFTNCTAVYKSLLGAKVLTSNLTNGIIVLLSWMLFFAGLGSICMEEYDL